MLVTVAIVATCSALIVGAGADVGQDVQFALGRIVITRNLIGRNAALKDAPLPCSLFPLGLSLTGTVPSAADSRHNRGANQLQLQ